MTARGWFLFALMGVLWGIPYLMIKVAVDGVSPSGVVFVRCLLGAALLLPFALRTPGFRTAVRTHWKPMLAFAGIEIIGPWWTLTDAERELSSSMAGLLIAAVPILGVVLARLFGDTEELGARRWTGLLLGLGGVALLAAPELSGGSTWAITEVFLTALGYATAPLIVTRRLKEVPTLHLIVPCLLLAAVVYAPAGIAGWPARTPSATVLMSLAGLGVFCTALAFVVFLELIREVGATRAVVFTYVNPAVAVAAGVAFLSEPLTAAIVGSFGLILVGSVLATSATRPARRRPGTSTGPIGRPRALRLPRGLSR
ncbi:DMT family transporter [Streptomyces sp. NPDC127098]|uniref:DMT family transporter n=1 Tax=Streptomyces sp. NPDC127098 TaxID=3347137 RepID=UPI0036618756